MSRAKLCPFTGIVAMSAFLYLRGVSEKINGALETALFTLESINGQTENKHQH